MSELLIPQEDINFDEFDQAKEYTNLLAKIINDPWEFACICYTQDQVDFANPIKKFPQDKEYLKLFIRVWEKERLVAVPKSRRMFMSWVCIILHLWDAMWHEGRHIAFVSKKEADADDLLERALFVLEHLDESILPKQLRPKFKKTYCCIEFPETGSKITGFPQGADQLRAYTFSRILADEMAFWEQAQKMYSSSFPTLDGGGCMTCISSAAPGFFKNLVFDTFGKEVRKE